MVEVVNFLVESLKCIGTWIEWGARSSYSKQRNRTTRFHKPDPLVLSILTAIMGTTGARRGATSLAKKAPSLRTLKFCFNIFDNSLLAAVYSYQIIPTHLQHVFSTAQPYKSIVHMIFFLHRDPFSHHYFKYLSRFTRTCQPRSLIISYFFLKHVGNCKSLY
jgi:hypothetical protein